MEKIYFKTTDDVQVFRIRFKTDIHNIRPINESDKAVMPDFKFAGFVVPFLKEYELKEFKKK